MTNKIPLTIERKSISVDKALLFRLPYPYGKKQVYLPTDLLLVGSRLEEVGVETKIHDLNLHVLPDKGELQSYGLIGIGVIGSPYIPCALQLTLELKEKTKSTICMGGPGVENLSPNEFDMIFKGSARQIRSDRDLTDILGSEDLPSIYRTPIAPLMKRMPVRDKKEYLSREFSLFVSQGCTYKCDFCAAKKNVDESFVELDVLRENVGHISEEASIAGIPRMSVYLSSLDLFQNPERFAGVLETFVDAQREFPARYDLRGLSRVNSFVNAVREVPELETLVQEAGLKTVGFGVDGTTEKIWRSQHKGQRKLSEVDHALDLCKKLAITPELLMVMGFPEDTIGSLAKTWAYTIARAATHGAVSRPYLAKSFVPGNKGWTEAQYSEQVNKLLKNPELFTNLDFAAFGSSLTHPDRIRRYAANFAYAAITWPLELFGKNATYPLMSKREGKGGYSRWYNGLVEAINACIPFDK